MAKKQKWLIAGGGALAAILLFCGWLFGWFRGDINMMRFSPDEVDRIELSSTDVRLGLHTAVVSDREDIRALVESLNSFQHTGSGLKEIFKYGIGAGGSTLYVCDVYLLSGENFNLQFASKNGERPWSDMELSYWVCQPGEPPRSSYTCRGSLELFNQLYEKYRPADQAAR